MKKDVNEIIKKYSFKSIPEIDIDKVFRDRILEKHGKDIDKMNRLRRYYYISKLTDHDLTCYYLKQMRK